MATNICILDYGSGNVKSVFNIFCTLSKTVTISNDKNSIAQASHIVLPGVGAFGSSMNKIKKKIPIDFLTDIVKHKKRPFLGICVGMQVLATKGFEFGEHDGLGWIDGEVCQLNSNDLPLPHIGWNNVVIVKNVSLLEGLTTNQDFYFVHSFAFIPKNPRVVLAQTEYGTSFVSIVNQDNVYGVQFHPEKSQKAGNILLNNFLKLT